MLDLGLFLLLFMINYCDSHLILVGEMKSPLLQKPKAMAEENQLIGCHNKNEWKDHFEKGKESKKLVVVDFTATWCGPCRVIGPILADLAKKTPNVVFLKVDVDELQDVATEWEIEAMPTILFLKEGKIVDKIVGAKKDELVEKVARYSAVAAA
ncbi:hypothetical protein F8388_003540 [Cannabis sativa]|uniref:Thioredoxin domain-containing protein n=2 Tax=Cannabis sativa TaxID=3483 RepID=A0A7J6EM56_CANSA|nr:hypothetical protein F8388_003540 [Cannabis sativa]KAF4372304.1 hypothetical protein G4B88_007048 [Cannabis sativa]